MNDGEIESIAEETHRTNGHRTGRGGAKLAKRTASSPCPFPTATPQNGARAFRAASRLTRERADDIFLLVARDRRRDPTIPFAVPGRICRRSVAGIHYGGGRRFQSDRTARFLFYITFRGYIINNSLYYAQCFKSMVESSFALCFLSIAHKSERISLLREFVNASAFRIRSERLDAAIKIRRLLSS